MPRRAGGASPARNIEWPTLALTAGCYGAFGLLTWFHEVLPWWLLLACGGYVVALHGSLQHETVHGHPTPWPAVNEALILPSLWLWMPFRVYRETHLAHHRDPLLTDPTEDPESYYVTAEAWQRRGPLGQALLWFNNTVAGRLLIGPLRAIWLLLKHETARPLFGEAGLLRMWLPHFLGVALVLAWVAAVCGMELWLYVLTFAYPGLSLTLLRSFLEHQARPAVGERTVLVDAGPVLSLMFLNNNLHVLHHAEPELAWYKLPARYRARREELLRTNGGYRYRGYWEIVARFLLWPKEHPAHPAGAQPGGAAVVLQSRTPPGVAVGAAPLGPQA